MTAAQAELMIKLLEQMNNQLETIRLVMERIAIPRVVNLDSETAYALERAARR